MTRVQTERSSFLVENLNLPRATGVEDARWEPFQLEHLNDDGLFRIENKSRQVSWSWTASAEAIALAILSAQPSIFVSINLDEAKEKIRYAKAVYNALEIGGLPSIVVDNQLELELSNGARLISSPSKAPRGKARFRMYLDEFAHVQHDRLIYQGAVPVISKGGCIRIGSSPMGGAGTFWEIFTESMQRYPGYRRKLTPWWEVYAFSKNVREARKLAPPLSTAERVELFGNDRIRALFANMPLEDFQQEYECAFLDESTSWIPWEEIRGVQDPALAWISAKCEGSDIGPALEAIDRVLQLIAEGKIEPVLAGGFDVGRTRNASELHMVGITTTGQLPLRLSITLERMPFEEQFAVLVRALEVLPIVTLLMDRNGLGMQLAENAERLFPTKAQGVDFTGPSKALWATNAKTLVQQHRTPLPVDRDLAYQIHSIKRLVTSAKNLVFDTNRNEKHHADKFWGWALGLSAAHTIIQPAGDQTVIYYDPVFISGI